MLSSPSTPLPATARALPLRLYLALLCLILIVPLTLAGFFIVHTASNSYRDATSERLQDTARSLAKAVEAELLTTTRLMRALANSAVVTDPEQLMRWARDTGLITDSTSSLRVVPALPADLPADSARWHGIPVQTLRAVQPGVAGLSQLFTHPDGTPQLALAVPVGDALPPAQFLVLQTPPLQLVRSTHVEQAKITDLLIAVTDGQGRVVSRSQDAEKFVGRPVPDWAKLQSLQTPSGIFEAQRADQGSVILAFTTLAASPGWTLVVGESLTAYQNRWIAPQRAMSIAAAIAILLAGVLAARLSRRILQPVQGLQAAAEAVARQDLSHLPAPGEEAGPQGGLRVREFDAMAQSLSDASTTLYLAAEDQREIAKALAASERRYRTLAHTGAVVLWTATPRGRLTSASGWDELLGLSSQAALGWGWARCVHPDDLAGLRHLRRGDGLRSHHLDLEFRLATSEGGWRWVRGRGAPFLDNQGAVKEWIGVLEDVDERRRAQADADFLAHHDALTGLPNRSRMHEQLDAARRSAQQGKPAAIHYLDLDRFKQVNDTLGHPVGDALLCAVADRLRGLLRSTDTVARLGGDEFSIVQITAEAEEAAGLARRVIDTLSQPYTIDGHDVRIGASVGIALATVHTAHLSPSELLKQADLALYQAKAQGRGTYAIFDESLQPATTQRSEERQLAMSDKVHGLSLGYQPIVATATQHLIGFQATVLGAPSPAKTRDKATASGPGHVVTPRFSATDVAEWVLRQACLDAALWSPGLHLSVVLPSALLRSPHLLQIVTSALGASGLQAQQLEIVVQEQELLTHAEAMGQALQLLKSLGVRVALGDFGSSQSAVGLLRTLPIDTVRIAQDMTMHADMAVHLARLCQAMGLRTTACGVESQAQRDRLQAESCAELQGPLFGGLVTAAEASTMGNHLLARPI